MPGGPEKVDEIRRNPPPNVEPSVWEEHIKFYMKEKNLKRAAVNKKNRKKLTVYSRHGSKSLAAIRHDYVRLFNYNYIKVINFNFIKVFKFN